MIFLKSKERKKKVKIITKFTILLVEVAFNYLNYNVIYIKDSNFMEKTLLLLEYRNIILIKIYIEI